MKSAQPNAEERKWRETVRMIGSIVSGYNPSRLPEVHHIAGRSAKHNKRPIGHQLIIPLTTAEHKLIDRGESGLFELKDIYLALNQPDETEIEIIEAMKLHPFEKYLFSRVCEVVQFPFGNEVYESCLNWHR